MKFTVFIAVDTNATVDEIAEALTDLGLEVEDIANPIDRLGAFTIGKVKEAEKHPDADNRVCARWKPTKA